MSGFAGGSISRSDGDGRTCSHLVPACYDDKIDVDVGEVVERRRRADTLVRHARRLCAD